MAPAEAMTRVHLALGIQVGAALDRIAACNASLKSAIEG
jgi:hypothetical protein